MIKCHLVKLGNSFDSIGEGHACKDLITGYALGQMDCDNGYFLTDSDLKRVAQEAQEDFARWLAENTQDYNFPALSRRYQAEQQAREGEG